MKKILLMFTLLTFGMLLSNCTTVSPTGGMKTVGSYSELKKLVANGRDNILYPKTEFDAVENMGSSKETSKTNIQVEGIDEGDIVKVDSNRIYQIYNNRLVVTSISNEMVVLLSETLNDEENQVYFSDLYLTNDYLVVIGQSYFFMPHRGNLDDIAIQRPNFSEPKTMISVYDLVSLEKVKTISAPGYLNTSRLIEGKLYLFSTAYINLSEGVTDPRPYYTVNDSKITPSYEDIYYHDDLSKEVFNMITTISLDEDILLEYQVFLGSSGYGTIYVSKTGIYLASYQYTFNKITNDYQEESRVFAFLFKDEGVFFGGSAAYKGYILNQFSIDEYNGYLRILTTDGFGDQVINRLYTYKHTLIDNKHALKRVSLLDKGIGKPRERIFSARFNKDQLTVVTFEQTDPLYLIDLSDPYKPAILSELEVPGFSLYQHNWSETIVLGIGYETLDAITIGLKLSMYDISDENNISELGRPLVLYNEDRGYTYGEALYNHKAILFDVNRDYFGFSISKLSFRNYQYTTVNEYVIFGANLENQTPIEIKKVISHDQFYEDTNAMHFYYTPYSIQRAVYVGDYLYVISHGAITKHDILNEFNQVSVLKFDVVK